MPTLQLGCDKGHHWKQLEWPLLQQNLAVVLDTIICTLTIKQKFICIQCQTGQKTSTKANFPTYF